VSRGNERCEASEISSYFVIDTEGANNEAKVVGIGAGGHVVKGGRPGAR
jgi:hypothetical protein